MSSHSDADVNVIFTIMGVIAFITFLIGIAVGDYIGHETACKSVQLEWVKDKCMKVTREEVK